MLTCHCTLFCKNNFGGARTLIFSAWDVTNVLSLDFVKFTPTSLMPPRFLVSVGVMFFMIEDVSSDKITCARCVRGFYFYNDYFTAALGYGTPKPSFGAILKMLFLWYLLRVIF